MKVMNHPWDKGQFKRLVLLVGLFLFFMTVLSAQVKVAAIGNSVTYGYSLDDPSENSYPAQLQKLLGDHYTVKNFGHSGATLLRKGHNPYHRTQEYEAALAYKPDIAIVHLGLNDTDPRNWPNYGNFFERDYAKLIEALRKSNPNVEIYITLMTPIFSGHPRFLSGTRDWYRKIQVLIPKIARENNVKLIDIHTPLKARSDLFDDYLHPNKQGYGIIARQVALAIADLRQPLQFHKTFSSDMVLQRGKKNKIHGTGTPKDKLTLEFEKEVRKTVVKKDGTWDFTLPEMEAGEGYELKVFNKTDTLVLKDVLFGDVYLASGQSNMAFPLKNSLHKDSVLKLHSLAKNIRLYKAQNLVPTNAAPWDSITLKKTNDLEFFDGKWEKATPAALNSFSAVAASFAFSIAQHEKVPIGIIDLSVGGSTTESWIRRYDLESDDLLAGYLAHWKQSDFMMDFVKKRTHENLEYATVKHQRHPYGPAYNFEAGISNWLDANIKAVLWYQGESNAHNVELHAHLFKTLIHSWRDSFGQELPFYTVQLPGINRPSWGEFRNSQRQLEKELSSVHMAVTLDLGDSLDVHPRNKFPVGERLALLVRKYEYKESLHADYPEVSNIEETSTQFILTFSGADELRLVKGDKVEGFQFKDSRGNFYETEAALKGKKVTLEKPDFPVKSIYYGYKPYSSANLSNELNVPVSTFKMDL